MKLLLGAGRKKENGFTTLDQYKYLNPDIVCQLGVQKIPLQNDSVDYVKAIHVLEHIGKQGETADWFYFWEELYRIMKPNGELYFEAPKWNSVWGFADPSHVRLLSPESLVFFDQDSYRIKDNIISPFRINCDFKIIEYRDVGKTYYSDNINEFWSGKLMARKPLRTWWS